MGIFLANPHTNLLPEQAERFALFLFPSPPPHLPFPASVVHRFLGCHISCQARRAFCCGWLLSRADGCLCVCGWWWCVCASNVFNYCFTFVKSLPACLPCCCMHTHTGRARARTHTHTHVHAVLRQDLPARWARERRRTMTTTGYIGVGWLIEGGSEEVEEEAMTPTAVAAKPSLSFSLSLSSIGFVCSAPQQA